MNKDMNEMFELLEEIIKITDEIKNSFDIDDNIKKLKRIKILRDLMNEILNENGVEDNEND